MDKNQKPKHFIVLRILGFISLAVGVLLILLGAIVFSDKYGANIGLIIPGAFMAFLAFPLLMFGFLDKISKATIRTAKYIQQQNQDDLKDISDNAVEIAGGAITKTAKAVKKGIKDTMFCKHCGTEIDADSKFCNKCGKEQ